MEEKVSFMVPLGDLHIKTTSTSYKATLRFQETTHTNLDLLGSMEAIRLP